MDGKRQKNQLLLAFARESRSEAPRACVGGAKPPMAKREAESPAADERLMEAICDRGNLWKALTRVRGNKGSPGVDGMTVHDLPGQPAGNGQSVGRLPAGMAGLLRLLPDAFWRELGLPSLLVR